MEPTAIPTEETPSPAPAITLTQLLSVLSELTEDEDEIVATLLHMVEHKSVRLVTDDPAVAESF